jgi:CRP-like cAMP-binding protein
MSIDLIATLNKLPLFSALPEEAVVELAGYFEPQVLAEGEVLFQRGDPGDALYIVAGGALQIILTDDEGRARILNEVGPGAALGEMTLITREPRTAGVVAAAPAEVLRLGRETFLQVVDRLAPQVMNRLREIAGHLRLTYADILKQIPFFASLPDSAAVELSRRLQRRELSPGEVLFSKGDIGRTLYIIDSGLVKIVTHDARGEELILNQCGPGEAIGEMSLLEESTRTAGVVAQEPTIVLQLERDAFMEAIRSHPDVALDIMKTLSRRLRFASLYIEQVIDISQRIAEGDYSFARRQIQTSQALVAGSDTDNSDEARIQTLLTAFFSMVEGVQEREDALKEQVAFLKIQIDEARRKDEVDRITSSDFFADLKTQLKRMREEDEE